jgi:hypothetical protein
MKKSVPYREENLAEMGWTQQRNWKGAMMIRIDVAFFQLLFV